jgi:hypothetical protein
VGDWFAASTYRVVAACDEAAASVRRRTTMLFTMGNLSEMKYFDSCLKQYPREN